MSTDTHTIADDQVRSAFQRWKNLEEEKARVAEDLKELFAEQKAFGHDTKAMRAAFRLKVKMDEADPADAEHEALVDTYLAALEAPRASRAYARENIEQFPALEVAPDLRPSLTTREAEESVVSNSAGSSSGKASDFGSEDAGSIPAPASSSDQSAEQAGGEHEVATDNDIPAVVPTYVTGEGAANTALPAKPKVSYRPNCQHPENCASGTRDHCWSCRRAMQKSEEAA